MAEKAGRHITGLAYRQDLPRHLAGQDGSAKHGLLNGTHNLVHAVAELKASGASFSIWPTLTDGIHELRYTLASPAGKKVRGRKTVYDPAILSDRMMLDSAMEAGQAAWLEYRQAPDQRIFTVCASGIRFRAYINADKRGNTFIGSVHPIK